MGFIKKTAVYLMTALLFVATTNIVLSAHICAGELINLSLYDKDHSCPCTGEPAGHDGDASHSTDLISGMGSCCFALTVETENPDIVNPVSGIKEIDFQVATLQLIIFTGFSQQFENLHKTALKPYSLPLTGRDIPVLVQSFLL
jgi:hypothetical protein